MKRSRAFLLSLLLPALPALGQEPLPAQPPAASAPSEEKASPSKSEEPPQAPPPKGDEAPAAAPKAEEKPKEEPRAKPPEDLKPRIREDKTLLTPEAPPPIKMGPVQAAPQAALEAEWVLLKASAEDSGSGVAEAAIEELEAFVDRNQESPLKPEALQLLASLRQKKGEYPAALVDFLRLLYEHPEAKLTLQAKSGFLELAERRLPRKLRPLAGELAQVPAGGSAAARLAQLAERLSGLPDDYLYEPALAEFRRLLRRFPDYPESDRVQWGLGQLHERADKPARALLAYRRLLAVFPESPLIPKARFALGQVYAEGLREPKRAIEAFQELFERHPGAPEVLASLERTAQLLSEKLKQHGLAVEVLDRIVKLFPKSEGALKAFNSMARLQRDKLGQSAEAVKTYLRLAEQFGPAGLEALQSAASVARRDLKDYAQEAALRRRIAADFPSAKEAASELLAAGEIYEGDLKDPAKALEVYKELSGKFPGTREARKASERAARLEKKPE